MKNIEPNSVKFKLLVKNPANIAQDEKYKIFH